MSSERMLQCGINPHANKTLAHLLPLVYYLQAELEIIGKILSCLSQEPPRPCNMALYMPSLYSSRVLIGLPDRPRVLLLSLSPTHSCLCRAAQKTNGTLRCQSGYVKAWLRSVFRCRCFSIVQPGWRRPPQSLWGPICWQRVHTLIWQICCRQCWWKGRTSENKRFSCHTPLVLHGYALNWVQVFFNWVGKSSQSMRSLSLASSVFHKWIVCID